MEKVEDYVGSGSTKSPISPQRCQPHKMTNLSDMVTGSDLGHPIISTGSASWLVGMQAETLPLSSSVKTNLKIAMTLRIPTS